jgi:hypothetical protein
MSKLTCLICLAELDGRVPQYNFSNYPICVGCKDKLERHLGERGVKYLQVCVECELTIPEESPYEMEYGDDGHENLYWHKECKDDKHTRMMEADKRLKDEDFLLSFWYREEIEALQAKVVDYVLEKRKTWRRNDEEHHKLYREISKFSQVFRAYEQGPTELLFEFCNGWNYGDKVAGGYDF